MAQVTITREDLESVRCAPINLIDDGDATDKMQGIKTLAKIDAILKGDTK